MNTDEGREGTEKAGNRSALRGGGPGEGRCSNAPGTRRAGSRRSLQVPGPLRTPTPTPTPPTRAGPYTRPPHKQERRAHRLGPGAGASISGRMAPTWLRARGPALPKEGAVRGTQRYPPAGPPGAGKACRRGTRPCPRAWLPSRGENGELPPKAAERRTARGPCASGWPSPGKGGASRGGDAGTRWPRPPGTFAPIGMLRGAPPPGAWLSVQGRVLAAELAKRPGDPQTRVGRDICSPVCIAGVIDKGRAMEGGMSG